jgi:hypothetical protein
MENSRLRGRIKGEEEEVGRRKRRGKGRSRSPDGGKYRTQRDSHVGLSDWGDGGMVRC